MTLEEAKERVERELFLAYDEEIEAETRSMVAGHEDGVTQYEERTVIQESDRAKQLREAMETVSDL